MFKSFIILLRKPVLLSSYCQCNAWYMCVTVSLIPHKTACFGRMIKYIIIYFIITIMNFYDFIINNCIIIINCDNNW